MALPFYPDASIARGVSCNSSNRLPEVSSPFSHNARGRQQQRYGERQGRDGQAGESVMIRATADGPTTPPILLLLAVTPPPLARSLVG